MSWRWRRQDWKGDFFEEYKVEIYSEESGEARVGV